MLTGPGAGYYQVWDGTALLVYNPGDDPKYQRMENPSKDERPDSTFFYRPGTKEFDGLCPAAKRLGTKTVFGRTAVRYHCDKVESNEYAPSMDAREIALDEKTGLVMVYGGPEVITEVTFGPAITAETFSTELPPGADSSVVAPEGESTEMPEGESTEVPPAGGDIGPYEIGSFRLRAVGGGFVDGASYRGKPFVIVAGPADGIRTAVGRLLPMTRAGKPPVVGFLLVLPAEDWKGSLLNPEDVTELADSISKSAGKFAVPVGLDFKGVASEMFMGTTVIEPPDPKQVTIALVASDGTFAHVTSARDVTDAKLRSWIAALS
jgi:hypothetical protein